MKKQKGISLILLILLIVLVLAIISVTIFISMNKKNSETNQNSNQTANETSNSKNNSNTNKNTITIAGKEFKLSDKKYDSDDITNNPMNEYGVFKVGDEYIFKGGDNYTEVDNKGNTSTEFKQGYLQNVVKFNDNYWRIVKVNNDGSIKLVYFGTYNKSENKVSNLLDLPVKYVETKSDDFTYEDSYLRNYLNTTFLEDNSVIPDNYTDYLVKSKWDISKYDIHSKPIDNKATISDYEDYVGVLSLNDYFSANYDYQITTGAGYKVNQSENYISNILNTAKNTKQLSTNTSNVVVNDSDETVGVARIERENGEFVTTTEYDVDTNFDNNVLPVITLKSTVKFASGDGSIENPYVVE